jgi:hypothetical protein
MSNELLFERLLSIEDLLAANIRGRAKASTECLPSNNELRELKSALDRLRPLLWIYLRRTDGPPTPAD